MVATGIYYALGCFAAGLTVGGLAGPWWAAPFCLAAMFCLWFFRDPEREIPSGPVAVSPADGKIIQVLHIPPDSHRVAIFMNIFDVHVNRAPVSGKIVEVSHSPGKYLVASRDAAASENERNKFTLQGELGRVSVVQIAGLIARRIVFYKRLGDHVTRGERIGLIKFGSRVDVLFGPEWEVTVKPGDRVRAGSSILARREESQRRS